MCQYVAYETLYLWTFSPNFCLYFLLSSTGKNAPKILLKSLMVNIKFDFLSCPLNDKIKVPQCRWIILKISVFSLPWIKLKFDTLLIYQVHSGKAKETGDDRLTQQNRKYFFHTFIGHFDLTISPGMPGAPWKKKTKNIIFRTRPK